jgi:hypothetical protein
MAAMSMGCGMVEGVLVWFLDEDGGHGGEKGEEEEGREGRRAGRQR